MTAVRRALPVCMTTDPTPAAAAQIPVPRDLVQHARRHAAAVDAGLVAVAAALVVGFVATAVVSVVDRGAAVAVYAAGFAVACAAFAVVYVARVVFPVDVSDGARAGGRAFFFFAAALVLPLAVHGLLHVWQWAPFVEIAVHRDRSFGAWVRATITYVPHTHIVFAALWALRAFGGVHRPRLAVIAAASVGVTLLDCLLWNVYGLLPTAFVAATLLLVLPLLRWLEAVFSAPNEA